MGRLAVPRPQGGDVLSDFGILDIETVGTPFTGQLLCVGWRGVAYTEDHPDWQLVLRELADPATTKVTFTKYDHRWLRLHGIEVAGEIHDVQVMAWMLDEVQALSLEACALRYCGIEMDKRIDEVAGRLVFRCDDGKLVPLEDAPRDQLLAYNERDLQATEALYEQLLRELEAEGIVDDFFDERAPFTTVLASMEATGVPVDLAGSEKLCLQLEGEIEDLELELRLGADLPADFNFGSSPQLAKFLYTKRFELTGRLELPDEVKTAPKAARLARMQDLAPDRFIVGKVGQRYAHGVWELNGRGFKIRARTDKGAPSTAGPKLRRFYGDDPWVQQLLDLKQRETLVTTFLQKFPRIAHGGRIYGRFNQTGTVTGRLSSSDPNLQNIPSRSELGRRVRALFRPEPGDVFVHGDYSQLEPRLSAHWSQDPVMLDIFRDDKDIYLQTARGVFGREIEYEDPERSIAKTFVLAMSYLAGASTLAQMLSENGFPTTEATADGYLKELRQLYRVFFAYTDDVVHRAEQSGFVTTLAGRRRHLVAQPARGGHWKESGLSPTQAVNAVIQGSAADVVERVMVRSAADFPALRLLVQVHDELMWQCRADAAPPFTLHKLQRLAERGHGFRLSVPLKFEPKVVPNWAAGK